VKASNGFDFEGGAKPDLFVEVLEPTLFDSVIGPNYLTAPGPPGSVDKGNREQRGVRLAISTKEPVNEARFKVRLTVRP
jgi:hypothetical protein